MSEFYEFDGTTYEVGPNRLDEFLEKFPNASKIEQPQQAFDSATDVKSDDFEVKEDKEERSALDILKKLSC